MKPIRLSLIITILILFLIIGYLYVSESFITPEQKAKYTKIDSETSANVFFLNPPNDGGVNPPPDGGVNPPPDGGVDPKTGIKKGTQIKYDCQTSGKDCRFDLLFL
jgi:hypothetical protein